MSQQALETATTAAEHKLQILAGETAREAASVIRAILRPQRLAAFSTAFFEKDHDQVWNELTGGGWLSLATNEQRGGVGLHLIDLAAVAEAWGESLMPLPFIPTMLCWRWSDRPVEEIDARKLTYSLADPKSQQGAVAPFLGLNGVLGVKDIFELSITARGALTTETRMGLNERGKPLADYAPSLPLTPASFVTAALPSIARFEIAFLAAAELVGVGARLLETTVEYARSRQQFGQPIVEYQAIQHRLANMHRDVEIARTAVTWAANEADRGFGAIRIAWDKCRTVSENAFQIHGGFGFTWDSGIHFYSRHIWAVGRLLKSCGVSLWPS